MKTVVISDSMLLPADRPQCGDYDELWRVPIPGWALSYLVYAGLNQYQRTTVNIDWNGAATYFIQD